MEMCLARVLRELRQQQKSNSSDSVLASFSTDFNMYLNGDDSVEEGEMADDPFQFLQQDPFENISLSDYTRKIKQKYGDEGFCFIMQALYCGLIHCSSSISSNNISSIQMIWQRRLLRKSSQLSKK